MGCISLFYHLLYMLEDMDLLNHNNPTDLFALHYIFLPRINRALDIFRETYSHHRLRTAGNCSPYQLWLTGLIGGNPTRDPGALQGVLEESLVNECICVNVTLLVCVSWLYNIYTCLISVPSCSGHTCIYCGRHCTCACCDFPASILYYNICIHHYYSPFWSI